MAIAQVGNGVARGANTLMESIMCSLVCLLLSRRGFDGTDGALAAVGPVP